jgi:hypothetical protein
MARAIMIHQTGSPEVLLWQEVEPGQPGPRGSKDHRIQYLDSLNLARIFHDSATPTADMTVLPVVLGS